MKIFVYSSRQKKVPMTTKLKGGGVKALQSDQQRRNFCCGFPQQILKKITDVTGVYFRIHSAVEGFQIKTGFQIFVMSIYIKIGINQANNLSLVELSIKSARGRQSPGRMQKIFYKQRESLFFLGLVFFLYCSPQKFSVKHKYPHS